MDLAELIHAHKGGRTYRDLEDACGGRLSHQRWGQLASIQPRTFPTPDTIVAVAAGLGVSERVVLLAAGESLGLHTGHRSRLADLIPEAADHLPQSAINAIVHLVNTMLALYEGLGV